jgi:tRNA threonylcarbamoyladenosine biosynthesis protein TsaB
MKILALELSSAQRSVAVLQRMGPMPAPTVSDLASLPAQVNEVIESGPVGGNVLGMIDAALNGASVQREQIETLAIGLGPGSYSGIRRAIAVAQGWQLGCGDRKINLLGISSVDCLAAEAHQNGFRGHFNIIIDAQRGEFYIATYESSQNACLETQPLRLAALEELREREAKGESFVGPDAGPIRGGHLLYPRAATLARLALGRSDFVPGEKLEPIYLRETQFVKTQPIRKFA